MEEKLLEEVIKEAKINLRIIEEKSEALKSFIRYIEKYEKIV